MARGILLFEKVNVPVLGVVENMASFVCDGCGKVHHPFGSSAATLKERFGLPTLAQLPILPGVSDAAHRDTGVEVKAFAELAERVHRAVGARRITDEKKPVATVKEGGIVVQWPDGTESRFANKPLRLACQCALCVNEFTGEPLIDADSIPEDIHAEETESLGNYAVAITWSDGHSSGIYSWEYLRHIAGGA